MQMPKFDADYAEIGHLFQSEPAGRFASNRSDSGANRSPTPGHGDAGSLIFHQLSVFVNFDRVFLIDSPFRTIL